MAFIKFGHILTQIICFRS